MTHYSPKHAPGQSLPRRTGQQNVVNEIGVCILRGDYPVGMNLPNEAELTARFSVSRTVIREVMKTLAAKGLVVAKTKVGTRVADKFSWNMFDIDVLSWRIEAGMDLSFLKCLYEVRIAIEPTAAALAAERRTEKHITILRGILDDMAAPGHTSASFNDADKALHAHIAKASGNPFMSSIAPIIDAAINGLPLWMSPPETPARQRGVVAAHAAIVDAIEARDARAARRAMIEVIDDGMQERGGDLQNVPT